ncbi:MAG: hypothetical protein JW717_01570 [Marinilabiliaceae bacterium]|nr:hypothetical protein [Marinilabiliaceae bacterium]
MKTVYKTLKYIFITIISIIILLFIIAEFAENKISQIALNQISKSINSPITINDISFSLLNNFPYATVEFNNFVMGASNQTLTNDTLAIIEKLFVSVKIRPLFNNVFDVKKIEIKDAHFNYKIDKKGTSCYDFIIDTTTIATDTTDTIPSALNLNLEKLEFENVTCWYVDSMNNMKSFFQITDLNVKGEIHDSIMNFNADGDIELSDCHVDSTNLHLMNLTQLHFDIEYINNEIKIDNALLNFDGSKISASGNVVLSDSVYTNLKVSGKDIVIESLLKFSPTEVLDSIGMKYISGLFSFDALINGYYANSVFPRVDANIGFTKGTLLMTNYPALKNIYIKGTATNGKLANNKTTKVDFSSIHFETLKSKADLVIKASNIDKPDFDIKASTKLDLEEFNKYIPDTLIQELKGTLAIKVSTTGQLPDNFDDMFINDIAQISIAQISFSNISAKMDSSLTINNFTGNLNYKPNNIEITSLSGFIPNYNIHLKKLILNSNINGSVTNMEKLAININKLQIITDSCDILAQGTVNNLLAPDYKVQGKIKLNLNEIKTMLPDSIVNSMSGIITTTFYSTAKLNLDSIANQANDIVFTKSRFDIRIEDISLNMPDTLMNVNDLNGRIKYYNDTAMINGLKGDYFGLKFNADSTIITNIYTAAIQNNSKELSIYGNFELGHLDYKWVENFMKKDTTIDEVTSAKKDTSVINFTYKANGKFKINSFKYGKVLFENISTKFLIKPNAYIADNFHIDAFGGNMNLSVKYNVYPNQRSVTWFKTDINKMDIHQLISDFDDFKEYYDPVIRSNQINGIFSSKMDGRVVLNSKYEPYTDSLMLTGDILLEDGALINVQAVKEIETIPGVGLKNLNNLKFSTLKSNLFIYNNNIFIPKTDIYTSSFEASFLGKYSFNGDWDFHIRVLLGQIFSGNVKKRPKEESGFNSDDKGRYLISSYLNGNSKVGLDNKKDRDKMITIVRLNNQGLFALFRPTLVNYITEVK